MGYTSRSAAGVGFTTASSALTASQHDINLSLIARGLGLDPVTLNVATTLISANHEGREIICNNATAFTLTIPIDFTSNTAVGSRFYGTNIGVGAVTIANAANVILVGDATLPATITQYSSFDVIRVGANTYIRRA